MKKKETERELGEGELEKHYGNEKGFRLYMEQRVFSSPTPSSIRNKSGDAIF